MGTALEEESKLDDALKCFQKAIQLNPNHANAFINLGNVLMKQKKIDEAISCYQTALGIDSGNAEAITNMGNAYRVQDNLDLAISCFQHALELKPDIAETYNSMGHVFKDQDNYEQAILCFQKALRLEPTFADAYVGLAYVYEEQDNLEHADACFQKALELDPDCAGAHFGIGGIYYKNGNLEKAISCCKKALIIDPDDAEVHYNLGVCLAGLGRIDESIDAYDQALKINPEQEGASWNRSLSLLLNGNFVEGLKNYERRLKKAELNNLYNMPLWDGSSFKGKKLFIIDEQGIGDTIQFIRYLPMVKEIGGTIVFETKRPLFGLFKNFYGIDALMERMPEREPPVGCDYYVPILSLPWIFGTTINTIPAGIPYLYADTKKVKFWQNRLAGSEYKVGLVWKGNPDHKNDRLRSCSLEDFAPLTTIPDIRLYGIQKGDAAADAKASLDGMVTNLGEELADFTDTAGLIANMDLIISVDTSVAHLAGAMGKQTWTLLPFAPDWRWMLDRGDSPWYPTMRLFRQPEREDWDGVFHELSETLRILVSDRRRQI